MTSGTGPHLPDSGWRVHYEDALVTWVRKRPSTLLLAPVTEWLRGVEAMGPPGNAAEVGDGRFLAPVPETKVTIEYLVIDYELLVIVKTIG